MDRHPMKHRQHGIFAELGIFFMLSAGKKEKGKGKREKERKKEGRRKGERRKRSSTPSELKFLF